MGIHFGFIGPGGTEFISFIYISTREVQSVPIRSVVFEWVSVRARTDSSTQVSFYSFIPPSFSPFLEFGERFHDFYYQTVWHTEMSEWTDEYLEVAGGVQFIFIH